MDAVHDTSHPHVSTNWVVKWWICYWCIWISSSEVLSYLSFMPLSQNTSHFSHFLAHSASAACIIGERFFFCAIFPCMYNYCFAQIIMHEILTNQMHELEMTTSYCWLSAKFMAEWNLYYLWLYTTPKFHRIASYEKRLPLWTNLPSRGTLIVWLEQWKAYRLFKTTLKYLSNKYDCIGTVPCYLTIRLSSSPPNQLSLVEVDFSLLTLELPFQSKSGSQVPLSILALSLKSKRWSSVFIYGTV